MAKRKAVAISTEVTQQKAESPAVPVKARKCSGQVGTGMENPDDFTKQSSRELYVDHAWLDFQPSNSTLMYTVEVKPVATLEAEEFNACFDLIETTSRADYEASTWGWHPLRKKKEMKDREMQYLLLRGPGTPELGKQILGFVSCMITFDSTPKVPVLYIYEIHLTEDVRGLGLGDHMMQVAENIAQRTHQEKTMLTCFVSNAKARRFYERRGYATDVCSPEERRTRGKVVKPDYVIMSKLVPSRLAT